MTGQPNGGRTPWSARVPLDPLFAGTIARLLRIPAVPDQGLQRGPMRPVRS
jgi:hypothetical protein